MILSFISKVIDFLLLDKSTTQIIHYHDEVTQHYQQTLENLRQLNQTITFLMKIYQAIRHKIETRIGKIMQSIHPVFKTHRKY